MSFIKTFINQHIDGIKHALSEENVKKSGACFRAGFFFILLVGTVISPIAIMFHTPSTVIWIMAVVFGFSMSSLLTTSPVFSRKQVFTIANYITTISIIAMVLFFGTMFTFHIPIKPL